MIQVVDLKNVWIDGVRSGSAEEVISANIDNPKQILEAIGLYLGGLQGVADNRAMLAALASADIQVQQIRQELDAAITENAGLKRRLVPDLRPIVEALRGVGLYEWMASAANEDSDLLDEIAAMNAAAAAGDVPNLVANYAVIAAAFPPSEELLRSWQTVLDAAGVPPQILAFIR